MERATLVYITISNYGSDLMEIVLAGDPVCLESYLEKNGYSTQEAEEPDIRSQIPEFLYNDSALIEMVRFRLPAPDTQEAISHWGDWRDDPLGEAWPGVMREAAEIWLWKPENNDDVLRELIRTDTPICLSNYLEHVGLEASLMDKEQIERTPAFLWNPKALDELLGIAWELQPYTRIFSRGEKIPENWDDYSSTERKFHVAWALKLLSKGKRETVQEYVRRFPAMADVEPDLASFRSS